MEPIINQSAFYKSGYTHLAAGHQLGGKKRGALGGVFGSNGSGKTTLLSMIAGYRKQTHGSGCNCLRTIQWMRMCFDFRKRWAGSAVLFLINI